MCSSPLGSFLRTFTFGHVRQLDAIASRFLIALAGLTAALNLAEDLTIGLGGLFGASLTLDSTRQLSTTGTTTIDFFRVLFFAENQPATRPAQSLVRGRRHIICVRNW